MDVNPVIGRYKPGSQQQAQLGAILRARLFDNIFQLPLSGWASITATRAPRLTHLSLITHVEAHIVPTLPSHNVA